MRIARCYCRVSVEGCKGGVYLWGNIFPHTSSPDNACALDKKFKVQAQILMGLGGLDRKPLTGPDRVMANDLISNLRNLM